MRQPPDPITSPPRTVVRVAFRVTGTVQGVGFRPTAHGHARRLGIVGWVANDATGVVGEAEGAVVAIERFLHALEHDPPPLARVERVESALTGPRGDVDFEVRSSMQTRSLGAALGAGSALPADTATCATCLAEVADPAGRRHRYPFTNCTACGPRLTIVVTPPYDRSRTTMAAFELCAECRREYEDPADRRFHAEATCCPTCGPRLGAEPSPPPGRDPVAPGRPDADIDPILVTAADIRAGGVVAVKGLGGYHLAALASDRGAVARIRRLKQREAKPMAVLVADLAEAGRLCHLDGPARELLGSARAPIVVAPRRGDAPVADEVAPATHLLGVLLPPTALHHLLIQAVGEPIVLTSANPTDEPMVIDDAEARARLAPDVDRLLTHDRVIASRVDDSVARVIDGTPALVRRARGWAPEPIRLAEPVPVPILAVGADRKATVAVAVGDRAWLSTHLGDLDHPVARDAHALAVDHLLALTGVRPAVVAHDLHPAYASSQLAAVMASRHGSRPVGVQHHHAHLAACLAEHLHPGPALGVAFDGLGYGTDGTAWGGEVGVVTAEAFLRLGHLEPVGMPGGAAAVREPWRMAVAHLVAAGVVDPAAPPPSAAGPVATLAARHRDQWEPVAGLARTGVRSPATTSVGRLFDAVAALCGVGDVNAFEGQAAAALETLAARAGPGHPPYPATVDQGGGEGLVLDAAGLIRAVVEDLAMATAPEIVAARFHAGVAALTADAVARLGARTGLRTVACSGGVFQNAVLAETLVGLLRAAGFEVLVHRAVPANDGGIALGQVAVAAATVGREPGAPR